MYGAEFRRSISGRVTGRWGEAPGLAAGDGRRTSRTAPSGTMVARSRTAASSSMTLATARTGASASPCRATRLATTSSTVAPSDTGTDSAGVPAAIFAPPKQRTVTVPAVTGIVTPPPLTLARPSRWPSLPTEQRSHEIGRGTGAQCDQWFPETKIPGGHGQARMLPGLVMVLGDSRFLSATMLASRQAGDLLSGTWQLITGSEVGGSRRPWSGTGRPRSAAPAGSAPRPRRSPAPWPRRPALTPASTSSSWAVSTPTAPVMDGTRSASTPGARRHPPSPPRPRPLVRPGGPVAATPGSARGGDRQAGRSSRPTSGRLLL